MILNRLLPKIQTLNGPLSIDSVEDGAPYRIGSLRLSQTNYYLQIGLAGELYIKSPSEIGWEEYRKFAKLAVSGPQDIRSLEPIETFEQLESLAARFPWLKTLAPIDKEAAHYLGICALQYERLRNQNAVEIPRARFGILVSGWLPMMRRIRPALFQQRVQGTTLWEMFDFDSNRVLPRWRACLPRISEQLIQLLESDLLNHIDWNIQNFVFDEGNDKLFYVDMKPTVFGAKSSNDLNLSGIRKYFIV